MGLPQLESKLQNRIDKWKRDLIDLTNRNVLLNFKPKKTNSIRFFEKPQEFFDFVVKDGKGLNMEELKTPFFNQVAKIIASEDEDAVKKKKLQEEKIWFNKLLSKLRLNARTRLNEQGIQTLYLVYGVLKWNEPGNVKEFLAPLILVPVQLTRSSANQPFYIQMVDDDIVLNPFLAHKLHEEKGICFPELDDKDDLDLSKLWKQIHDKINGLEDWDVLPDIYLAMFSFSKLVMYKDLDNYHDMLENHPLIRAMSGESLEDASQLGDLSGIPDQERLDKEVPSQETFQVLDADSSQLQAILSAKEGVSFVLQGPPGTGKSQTISNIIAECLAVNKKVLFVSEKMAALEVVKSRLEQVGLGSFCLELHSYRANKRVVLDTFSESINLQPERKNIKDEIYLNINNLRAGLNNYAHQLHKIRQPIGKSVYELHGKQAKLDKVPELFFDLDVNNINLTTVPNLLNELERYRNFVIPVKGTPVWEGFNQSVYSLELSYVIESIINSLISNVNEISQTAQIIRDNFGLTIKSVRDFRENHKILETALYSPTPPRHWFSLGSIKNLIGKAKEYQERTCSYLDMNRMLSDKFHDGILDIPLSKITGKLFKQYTDMFNTLGTKDPITFIDDRFKIEEGLQQAVLAYGKIISFDDLVKEYGLPTIRTINDAKKMLILMSIHTKNTNPTKKWFTDYINVKNTIFEVRKQFYEWDQKCSNLYQRYHESVLNLDLFSLRQSLETKGSEVTSYFKPANEIESADSYVFSKRISIKERINKILVLRERFNHAKKLVGEIFEMDFPNLKEVRTLKNVVDLVSKNPRPQTIWFNNERHHDIYKLIEESKVIYTKYHQELENTTELYEEEVIDEKVFDIFDRFENKYQSVWRIINSSYSRDRKWLASKLKLKKQYDFDTLYKHVLSIKRILEYKKWINDKEHSLRSMLGWHYKSIQTNWEAIVESFLTVQEIIQNTRDLKVPNLLRDILINPKGQLLDLVTEYNQLSSISSEIKETLISLNEDFPNLFEMWKSIPVESWPLENVSNYSTEIQSMLTDFFDKADKLTSNTKTGTISNISLSNLLEDIDLCLEIISMKNTFLNKEAEYKCVMGSWYHHEQTPWDILEKALADFGEIYSVTSSIPELYQTLLIKGATLNRDRVILLEKSLNQLDQAISILLDRTPLLFKKLDLNRVEKWQLSSVLEEVQWLQGQLENWIKTFEQVRPSIKLRYDSFEDLRKDFEQAVTIQKQKYQLEEEFESLTDTFGNFFSGYITDWNTIFDALAWLEEWFHFFKGKDTPEKLLEYVSYGVDTDKKQSLSKMIKKMVYLNIEYDNLYKGLEKYFEQDSLRINEMSFENSSCDELINWLYERANSLEFLEDWVRYKRLEKQIKVAGLFSFLERLKQDKPSNGTFLELFEKRFYNRWLDKIYGEEEVLYDFEADKVHDAVSNFIEYDLKSLNENSKRVQKKLMEKRKHAIESLAFRKELSVLLHEIGKKKRHIAIRKLLAQTSALAQEIKPCFLMSPLSVSQFLDAREIFFDVLIFDEASQIFPEDAIGPIIRASQVIIVGDNKQLPPTDFFKSTGIGEEFEDEDDVEYESILDECMYVLPNLRLLWHYRSRHESLITFSNRAFYQNSLITFPSAENGEDIGIGFVHVPDGTYDRGGTRSNKREAEVTAQLVFDHFRKYPKRSLGVIAFSEAQATEIRERVESLRELHIEMETFFKEGHPDEFFIKSLENVQGDERDVIFFSVGYGKSPEGTLYMNFGPLSKNGGERRLNVAVTRSKYQVKLISSLLPQEIPIERTQSIGVHRLREYMQMAMNGVMPNYIETNTIKVFDSPFEEDVYDVLVDMGYEVDTQVGCSGYRIDLAVLDPLRPGCYLIAIECDGKTYHSSKVARDRDRLRQQVLENLGWKVHRIWSQEWFKKRKFEVTRLKNLLQSLRYQN